MKNIFLSAFTSIFLAGISLNAIAQEASVAVEKAAADNAAESLLGGSAPAPTLPTLGSGEVKPAEVAAPKPAEANQMPEVSLPETVAAPATTPAPAAEVKTETKTETVTTKTESTPNAEVKAEPAKAEEAKPEAAKVEAEKKTVVEEKKSVKTTAKAEEKPKKASVKKSAPAAVSIPATPPKSFSKVTDFNTVVVSGGMPTSNTVWRPASQATRVQEISAPNLTIENDDYNDSFLSKLKIPDPRAKAPVAASAAREAASEGNRIEIERNSFKDLFAGAAEATEKAKPKTVEVDYSNAILAGNAAPAQDGSADASSAQSAALTTAGDKFNPLDGLAEQDSVDASEVQEIEVDSLNYESAQPKNFYMRDLGMKVEVKSAAKADVKAMRDAYDALQLGQIETAIEFYKKATAENPGDTKAMFGLATAYHMAGQRSEAKATYKKIINDNPNYSQAVNNYIVLVGEEGGNGAINELRGLMQKNPNYALIPAQMGSIYFKKLDMKQAAEYYSMAVALEPENNNYKYNLARIYDKMGAYERARSLYGELIEGAFKGEVIPVDVDDLRDRYMEISKG